MVGAQGWAHELARMWVQEGDLSTEETTLVTSV